MKINYGDKRTLLSVIALVAAFSILLSMFIDKLNFNVKAEGIWDGSISAPTVGDGSETNPYLITSAEELAYLVQNGGKGKYYKLTKDIYLNDVTKINWDTGAVDSGYTANQWYISSNVAVFSGKFDGNGHVIYGLYVNTTDNATSALFPKIQQNNSDTIKNLGIESSYISTGNIAGAFVGETVASGATGTLTIENCFASSNVTVTSKTAGVFYARGGTNYMLDKCYSLAKVNGTNKKGIVAETWGSFRSIKNTYFINTMVTNHGSIDCVNVYSTNTGGGKNAALLTDDNMRGVDVLTSASKMIALADCNAFKATTSYPTLKVFADFIPTPEPEPDDEEDKSYWNGTTKQPADAIGDAADPYLINSAEELAYIVKNGGKGKNYKLTKDIYLNDVTKIDWNTGVVDSGYTANLWYTSSNAAVFSGTFDGDGHIIYGLYANSTDNTASALFPKIQQNNSDTIKNLGIDSAYISTGNIAGAFVGETVASGATGTLTVENCFASSKVTITAKTAGVFYGRGGINYTIDKCYSLAKIDGTTKKGMIGETWGSNRAISNSYVVDSVITNHGSVACENVYSTDTTGGKNAIKLSSANMKGQDSITAANKMNKLSSCQAFEPTATYPVLKIFYAALVPDNAEIWDGTIKQPADATGDEANPYLIESAEELAYLVQNGGKGKYYKLTKDIYLNDVTKVNWSTGVAEDGYSAKKWYTSANAAVFNGTFDGDGHIIYGLYVNSTDSTASALFPKIQQNNSDTIKNLGIDSAYISTGNIAGAFVGETVASGATGTLTITTCFVGSDVTVKAKIAAAFYARGGSKYDVSECYTLANIIGTSKYGMVGETWGSARSISDSYALNIAITNHGTVECSNVYTTNVTGGTNSFVRTENNMQGLDVLNNHEKMSDLAGCGAFFATNEYPILKIFSDTPIVDDEEIVEGKIWSGKVATKFAAGAGEENDPYIISNGAELAYAIKGKGFNGSYFKLTNDIYLNDVTNIKWAENTENNKWITSTEFNGHIDGCGFIVYGMWFPKNNSSNNVGLISVFNKGYIKNLGVRYAQVYSTANSGGIIGRTSGSGLKIVDKCFVDESVAVTYTTAANGCAGGIIGQAGYEPSDNTILEITNCYSKARIYGENNSRTNGIIGTAWQCSYKISNCYSKNFAPYSALNSDTCSHLKKLGISTDEIYTNIYTDARKPKEQEVFTFISDSENLIGKNAKKYMKGLDFDNIFEVVETSTPKLKIFKSISGEDVDLTGDTQAYASGKGTKSNPFVIANAEQLRYLLQSENTKGKYYKLAGDIYINDTSKANWKVNNPSIWYTSENSEVFAGYIEGNGHSIYGLFMNETPSGFDEEKNNFVTVGTALFPSISTTAVIRNIHIRNSYISYKGFVGSIAGKITDVDNGLYAKITGCSADKSVELKGQLVGGIVAGRTDRGLKVHYCYFTGKIFATAPHRANSIVGDIWGRDWEMLACYGVEYPVYRYPVKPNLIAVTYGTASIEGCKLLKLDEMLGEAAKNSMKDFEWEKVWVTVSGDTPALKVIPEGLEPKVFDEGIKGQVWTGYRATKFAGGDGTKNNPYIIETPEQMALLVTSADTKGKYYKLTADLKLNDTSKADWQKNAKEWFAGTINFAGYFDGDGHVVSGLYFNTSYSNTALFQNMTSGAVIEKVGITKSYIYNYGETKKTSYAAALVASVTGYEIPVEQFVMPRISMCFADHTVSVEGYSAGGLIGGCAMYIQMDNCYFTGALKALGEYGGQAIGNTWYNKTPSVIKNSYFVSDDGYPVADHPAGSSIMLLENVYQKGEKGTVNGAISVASMLIRGENAKKKMSKLDYKNIWQTVEGGTPVLRCFANAEKYSCTVMPNKVEISFASQGGSHCESLFGYPSYDDLTVDMLPTPTRYGYKFGGWYYFSECFVPVVDGLFPDYSTVFYAKWIPQGFTVDFEGNLDSKYDYNKSAEHYKPGASGYLPIYVNQGLKSMVAKSGQKSNPRFLLSYENTLEIGQVYDVVFWICTDSQEINSTTIKLLHANHPQVDSDIVGYNTLEVKNIRGKIWQKVQTQITANTQYLIFETNNKNTLYFDDIQVVPLGKTGKLGELESMQTNAGVGNYTDIIIISVIAGVVVLLAVVVIILIVKKHKMSKN